MSGSDYIISISPSGTITAYPGDPNAGLQTVTGTDLGIVVDSCVTNIMATSLGQGMVVLMPPIEYGKAYPCATAMNLHGAVSLITAGLALPGANGSAATNAMVQIDFTNTSATTAIVNPQFIIGVVPTARDGGAGTGYNSG